MMRETGSRTEGVLPLFLMLLVIILYGKRARIPKIQKAIVSQPMRVMEITGKLSILLGQVTPTHWMNQVERTKTGDEQKL